MKMLGIQGYNPMFGTKLSVEGSSFEEAPEKAKNIENKFTYETKKYGGEMSVMPRRRRGNYSYLVTYKNELYSDKISLAHNGLYEQSPKDFTNTMKLLLNYFIERQKMADNILQKEQEINDIFVLSKKKDKEFAKQIKVSHQQPIPIAEYRDLKNILQ